MSLNPQNEQLSDPGKLYVRRFVKIQLDARGPAITTTSRACSREFAIRLGIRRTALEWECGLDLRCQVFFLGKSAVFVATGVDEVGLPELVCTTMGFTVQSCHIYNLRIVGSTINSQLT